MKRRENKLTNINLDQRVLGFNARAKLWYSLCCYYFATFFYGYTVASKANA